MNLIVRATGILGGIRHSNAIEMADSLRAFPISL